MYHHFAPRMDFHKIKVNKKGSYNEISKVKNEISNSYIDYLNFIKKSHINSHPNLESSGKISDGTKNQNLCFGQKKLKKGNSSNSEEKKRNNNLHIKCIEENINNEEGNILDDLINNKYLKPILESQNLDEKLLNCNLKEPVKNKFNVSLNDFFNRRKKYYINFKTPKLEINKIRGLSIKTNNINSGEYYYNDFSSSLSHNKTMVNFDSHNNSNISNKYSNNINNYYNDIQMTNNYYNNYNNNEINIINPHLYNNNNNIRLNNLCSSSIRKKIKQYFSSANSNERNKTNFISKVKSPDLHLFKSQTYSQKQNFSENLIITRKNNIIRNYINKEINIRNLTNENLENSADKRYEKIEEINNEDNMNKKFNDIKNIIKHNNKYNYSKKLFDIYRGKLLKEFLRHIQKGINKYLLNIFRYSMEQIQLSGKKNLKKIDEIFIPKIYLERTDKDMKGQSSNIGKNPYLQIFNSDKKDYKRYSNNSIRIVEYKRNCNKKYINNSAIISNEKYIDNNYNVIESNRNTLMPHFIKNNIQMIKMNTNNKNNGLIYKKKNITKNNIRIKKNNNNMLSNSRGKIIDIDINLGKPIRDISDINPMESGIFINDYKLKNKKFKSSMSTNKRERKKKSKSKRKKLSLPKKKYLEEKYDSSSSEGENNIIDKNISNNNIIIEDNSFDNNLLNNNFTIKTNNNIIQPLIYKSSRITINKNKIYQNKAKNPKIILEKNIITKDKRLFISINYIANLSYENKFGKKSKYINNLLTIKRNIYFPIFSQNIIRNKIFSKNYCFVNKSSRNTNCLFDKNNKIMYKTSYESNDKNKYLNSCVKFMIKSINKIFLGKNFKFFLNEFEIKCKKNRKIENNQRNIFKSNTYIKKIRKNKL